MTEISGWDDQVGRVPLGIVLYLTGTNSSAPTLHGEKECTLRNGQSLCNKAHVQSN